MCGERSGTIGEHDLDAGLSFGNGYEQSKFRAEQLVRAAGRGALDRLALHRAAAIDLQEAFR
ncbi:SDR family oxidoreductase [Nocardia brasiliensis]|uniref:SDR family oxidoreductase n=1 Tax=Nocardia brasiliensis TaxID=37326 RepID=UPI0024577A74|nr:SDR family oxidoreductase [Nocardia brasiliensis]